MKYASFFSGIAGFELALDAAGHKRVFSCEVDEFCNKVMRARYGKEHTAKDIRKVQAARIPNADIWVGGFPCQDLSVAGKRGGITASRSGLVWRLLELAKIRRPSLLVLENVPGLLNSKQGRDLALLVREMEKLRYVGCYRVLDAQFTGVPQRRRRVFLVGYLGAECPLEVLFEPKSFGRDPQALTQKRKNAAKEVARCVGGFSSGGIDVGAGKGDVVASAITSSAGHKGHSSPRGDGSDNLVVDDRKILPQAMTSKWAKGSSGPAGDEHHNLVIAAPITAGSRRGSTRPRSPWAAADIPLADARARTARGIRRWGTLSRSPKSAGSRTDSPSNLQDRRL